MSTERSKNFILLAVMLVSLGLQAQKDRVWIDNTLTPCKKGKASHYLVITKGADEHMLEMYDMSGSLKMTGASTDAQGDNFHGYFEFYHPNGKVESKGNYIDDHKVGVWERFDRQGNRLAERMYAAYNPAKNAFFYVDEMPMYEGGDENFLDFLKHKLEPLVNETESAEEGVAIELGFVVSEQGFIEGVELVKGLDDEWNQKALKVLQALPTWMPGKKSGENVRVWMQLAVNL